MGSPTFITLAELGKHRCSTTLLLQSFCTYMHKHNYIFKMFFFPFAFFALNKDKCWSSIHPFFYPRFWVFRLWPVLSFNLFYLDEEEWFAQFKKGNWFCFIYIEEIIRLKFICDLTVHACVSEHTCRFVVLLSKADLCSTAALTCLYWFYPPTFSHFFRLLFLSLCGFICC